MSTTPEPLHSTKGQQRAERIRVRIDYLRNRAHGWEAKALSSALEWALARLAYLERRRPTISQAQAVAIIDAWREAGGMHRAQTDGDGVAEPGPAVLDGMDFEGLGIR